jgi:hypothetical protein
MKINEVIPNEHSRTSQIQQEVESTTPSIQLQQPKRKIAQINSPQLQQKRLNKRQLSTRPIPNQIKHNLIQDKLTKQLMCKSNIVKPTALDLKIAHDRVATAIKRDDLAYQKLVNKDTYN